MNDEETLSMNNDYNNRGGDSAGTGSNLFRSAIRYCNAFAISILTCCVVWIFLQLQYVWYTLNQESEKMDKLLDEIQNQQTQDIDELNQKVDDNHSLTLIQMAGTFTLLTCLITLYHMTTHLRNYHEPIVQKRIISILWMCPIYALTAFLSLLIPSADGYLGVIRDFYEAYTVYNFLSLLINILGRGDRDVVVNVLAEHAEHLKPPTKCFSSCYHPLPETSNQAKANAVLFECQVLVMQFVFCRPLTSIASFVSFTLMQNRESEGTNSSDHGPWDFFKTPNFYISMITNISVFLAFTGLLKFYHAVANNLLWCQPFNKFMAIKGIVFLTFWQGLLIAIFVSIHEARNKDDNNSGNSTSTKKSSSTGKSAQEQATQIQHILICLEMVFFSIAHLCVFPAEEWEPNYRPKETRIIPSMGITDFARDVKFLVTSHRNRSTKNKRSAGNSMDEDDEEAAAAPAKHDTEIVGLQNSSNNSKTTYSDALSTSSSVSSSSSPTTSRRKASNNKYYQQAASTDPSSAFA